MIINNNHIITSARCVYNVPYVEVKFLTVPQPNAPKNHGCGKETRKINRIHIPSDYVHKKKSPSVGSDMAILAFTPGASSEKCYSMHATLSTNPFTDYTEKIGVVSGDRSADMLILSQADCKKAYKDIINVTDTMLCANRADPKNQDLSDIDDGKNFKIKLNFR